MAQTTLSLSCGLDAGSNSPCPELDEGYIGKIALMHPKGNLTVAGNCPTKAELQTGTAGTGANKVIILDVDGVTPSPEPGESARDEGVDLTYFRITLEGKVKKPAQGMVDKLASLTGQTQYKLWTITNTGYCRGGSDGFKAFGYISPLIPGTQDEVAHITFKLTYDAKMKQNKSVFDANYESLDNPTTTSTTTT